jgi:hypothetical protein
MNSVARLTDNLLAIVGGMVVAAALQAAEPKPEPTPAPTPTPRTDRVLLRYVFRPGDDLASAVTHRALTETTMNGVTQSVETSTDSTRTWKVVAVDQAGQATLEQVVDEVTMTSRSSDQGEVRWASAGLADPPPGYEGVRQSLGVPLVRLRVAADGRATS